MDRIRLSHVFESKNSWIAFVFVIYLACIPSFAWAYFRLYKLQARESGREHFFFNSDIAASRIREHRRGIQLQVQTDVPRYEKEIKALSQLQNALRSGAHPDELKSVVPGVISRARFHTLEFIFDFEIYGEAINWDTRHLERRNDVNISDGSGQLVESATIGGPQATTPLTEAAKRWVKSTELPAGSEYYQQIVDSLVMRVQGDYKQLIEHLNQTDESDRDLWSYWDFVYFSTITQTTVGYGDILPNSTLVRMIVCAQVLLGLSLLGIAINLALPSRNSTLQRAATPGQ